MAEDIEDRISAMLTATAEQIRSDLDGATIRARSTATHRTGWRHHLAAPLLAAAAVLVAVVTPFLIIHHAAGPTRPSGPVPPLGTVRGSTSPSPSVSAPNSVPKSPLDLPSRSTQPLPSRSGSLERTPPRSSGASAPTTASPTTPSPTTASPSSPTGTTASPSSPTGTTASHG